MRRPRRVAGRGGRKPRPVVRGHPARRRRGGLRRPVLAAACHVRAGHDDEYGSTDTGNDCCRGKPQEPSGSPPCRRHDVSVPPGRDAGQDVRGIRTGGGGGTARGVLGDGEVPAARRVLDATTIAWARGGRWRHDQRLAAGRVSEHEEQPAPGRGWTHNERLAVGRVSDTRPVPGRGAGVQRGTDARRPAPGSRLAAPGSRLPAPGSRLRNVRSSPRVPSGRRRHPGKGPDSPSFAQPCTGLEWGPNPFM